MAHEVPSSSPQLTYSPSSYYQAPQPFRPDSWEYTPTTQLPFGFIDLTAESSPPALYRTAARRSRSREIPESPPSAKRRRVDQDEIYDRSHHPSKGIPIKDIEEVDLRDVDDNPSLTALLAKQRADTIRAQIEQSNKPLRLTTKQCVICMENMTNITATHCGHLFCHTCILEALIAGENQGPEPGKGPSRCPICRKKVIRGKESKDPKQVVPLELKLKAKSIVSKGKEKA